MYPPSACNPSAWVSWILFGLFAAAAARRCGRSSVLTGDNRPWLEAPAAPALALFDCSGPRLYNCDCAVPPAAPPPGGRGLK
eukprot:5664355-Pyramimonas_sp.AAC.1